MCVTGGVPRYLEEINTKESAEQNIKQLCFTQGSVLLEEFDKIFSDLFGKHAEDYQSIVRTVLNQAKTMEQICESLDISPTGYLNEKLKILSECGFLTRDYVWDGKKLLKKLSKYRLKDNYLRFYLKYINSICK